MTDTSHDALARAWLRVQPGLDLHVSPDDRVYRTHTAAGRDPVEALSEYLAVGYEIVDALDQVLSACGLRLGQVASLLDCGCGYGRSTRFLVHRVPPGCITVCDSDPAAVAFHAERFAVRGAVGVAALGPARFDLITAIDVFNGLPERLFIPLLHELVDRLPPGGVLVASTASGEDGTGFEHHPGADSTLPDAAERGVTRCSPEWFERVACAVPGVSSVRRATRVPGRSHDLWALGRNVAANGARLRVKATPRLEIDVACVDHEGRLEVAGWALDGALRPVATLDVRGAGRREWTPPRTDRPDVAARVGEPAAIACGFELRDRCKRGRWPRHIVVSARDGDGRIAIGVRRVVAPPRSRTPSESEARVLARMRRGRDVLAYGGLYSVHEADMHATGLYPHLAERAEGCRLWDASGCEYVDWFMGWGPMLLGHRHPAIEAAIERQLRIAPALSLMHDVEIEVAEQLTRMIPCAERVAFGKNGSDVTLAAVRTARAATGRDLVVTCGYHGFHDWSMAQFPWCAGIPGALRESVRTFPYNDLEALASVLDGNPGRVAAVILEPTANVLPAAGFLEGVKRLSHAHGAALIFDEMVTGFRVSRGGAQEAYGVVPDMACFGKALANGMPLSALVGRTEVMSALPRVGFGLTYRGELLSLAAARAALDVHAREPVARHVEMLGEAVRTGFARRAREHGLAMELEGFAGRMTVRAQPVNGISELGLRTVFVQECLRAGVLTNGTFMGSYAHDDAAVQQTLAAFDAALAATERAADAGLVEPFVDVPVTPAFYEA